MIHCKNQFHLTTEIYINNMNPPYSFFTARYNRVHLIYWNWFLGFICSNQRSKDCFLNLTYRLVWAHFLPAGGWKTIRDWYYSHLPTKDLPHKTSTLLGKALASSVSCMLFVFFDLLNDIEGIVVVNVRVRLSLIFWFNRIVTDQPPWTPLPLP